MRIHRTKTNSSDGTATAELRGSPFGAEEPGRQAGLDREADGLPEGGDLSRPVTAAEPLVFGEPKLEGGTGDGKAALKLSEPTLELGRQPWDPAKVRSRRPARAVRVLTGVTESLLDRIPTERPRYTALACVMMCTATVAGISMFFALGEVLDVTSGWFIPFALFWAGFILSVDRWLVSAAPSKHSFAKLQTLLLRLGIAVILGFIIAEPLLLRVFQTAVVNEVVKERTATTNYGVSMYKQCNPTGGQSAPAGLDCTSWTLSASGAAPTSDQAQIAGINSDVVRLTSELSTENSRMQQLAQTVQDECDGVKGPGLTGHVGDGPACQSDEQRYQDYKSENAGPMAQQNSDLAADEAQLASLTGKENLDTKAVAKQISNEIDAWIADQPSKSTPIGLIERFNALIKLSSSSFVVDVGAWLLRLFFISIDCMPVLVKFIGGATPYDEFARREINIAHEVLQVEGRTRVDVAEIHRSLRLKWEHAHAARQEQSFNAAVRDHAAAIEAKQWDAIDRDYALKLARMGIDPHPAEPEPETELADESQLDEGLSELSTPLSDSADEPVRFAPIISANGWAEAGTPSGH